MQPLYGAPTAFSLTGPPPMHSPPLNSYWAPVRGLGWRIFAYEYGQPRFIGNICSHFPVQQQPPVQQLPLRRQCALCSIFAERIRPFTTRDLVAVNAQRVSLGREEIMMPPVPCFKCATCENALRAATARIDAQPAAAGYSPAKRVRTTSRKLDQGDLGQRLTSRRGSTTSREAVWDLAHRTDDNTVNAAIMTMIDARVASRAQTLPLNYVAETTTAVPEALPRADTDQHHAAAVLLEEKKRRADQVDQRRAARAEECKAIASSIRPLRREVLIRSAT